MLKIKELHTSIGNLKIIQGVSLEETAPEKRPLCAQYPVWVRYPAEA